MILAAHQLNFIPWLPYFSKMHQADVFVLMSHCQFEKNGFQNRANISGQWWTMPVKKGMKEIKDKEYVSGTKVVSLNERWIIAIALTLGIDVSKIRYDFPTEARGTERIIELCKYYDCDKYLTNPEAMDKYLNESELNKSGIEVIEHFTPYNIHTFEAFEQFGIPGTQKILAKEKLKFQSEVDS